MYQEYAKRRQQLLQEIGEGSIAILVAAPELQRTGDTDYPYRQNSDFYYMTGFAEPEAVAVFIPKHPEGEFILFNRERNPQMEVWTGPRLGQVAACEQLGADRAFSISQLDQELPKLLENRQRVYYAVGRNTEFQQRLMTWVASVQRKIRSGVNAPSEFFNIEKFTHEMRLRKSAEEVAIMRQAAAISAEAHCKAMQMCRPGMMEYELEAEVQATFTRRGSRSVAYPSIVGGGGNACILHYTDNNAQIKEGDLVLIDAGAEYKCYAADITRTFPANGRFSPEQRAIYEIVLVAEMATIAAVRPGLVWNQLQEISDRVVTEGLHNLGLLKGKLEDLLASQACRRFYMHKISHWLGLDTHDVGNYKVAGNWRKLEPGFVLTVEPGIYIPANSEGVDEKWWNIGIRVEDDVLVTENGNEVLTAGVPKQIDEIEALMATTC
jgi:Xaa-Pro aminopeptidase